MRQLPIVCLIFCFSQASSFAQNLPQVKFDVPAVVSCRDITTEDFARTHSLEKLLEVRIKASSLIESGSDRLIRELFFFIYAPERSLRIVECLPATTMLTEYAAPIDVSQNQENSNTVGLSFTPQLELAGKANLNANLTDRKGETQRISRLPPKQLAIASGTQRRETAAYFKFKPSSQATLEGSQELLLTVRVPNSWRADLLHMHCRAVTGNASVTRTSRADFIVPLHIESDAPAKIKCDQLLRAEQALRAAAAQDLASQSEKSQPKAIEKLSRHVTVFVKKEILRQSVKPPVNPNLWLGRIIFTGAADKILNDKSLQLSAQTQSAIRKFSQARSQLVSLNH